MVEFKRQFLTTCSITLGCILVLFSGCNEKFIPNPPFSDIHDTINLGLGNWYYIGQDVQEVDGIPAYPFSYQIFNGYFEGYIAQTEEKIYLIANNEDLKDKVLLLDKTMAPGDTMFRFMGFRYHLLLDHVRDQKAEGDIYYLLRRDRLGEKRLQERAVWVVSPTRGILAAADCDVSTSDGKLTLTITGDPDYFSGSGLQEKIRFYFYEQAWYYDRDNELMYEFDKNKATLRSRDVKARQDLNEYQFKKANTRSLTRFELSIYDEEVRLQAGDSCYYFTRELELRRSGLCDN